jgi:hypothetical protein
METWTKAMGRLIAGELCCDTSDRAGCGRLIDEGENPADVIEEYTFMLAEAGDTDWLPGWAYGQ